MAFGFNPAGNGFPSQAPEGFPNYIQFRADGENLGDPDVDTVDFVYPLVATRGTGENSNVVTVTTAENPSAQVPSGAAAVMAFTLSASGSGNGLTSWSFTSLLADASVASYNEGTNELTFAGAGLYQAMVTTRATVGLVGQVNLITLASDVGSGPDDWTQGAPHYVDNGNGRDTFLLTDQFVLDIAEGDEVRTFVLTSDNTEESLNAALSVVITKLA